MNPITVVCGACQGVFAFRHPSIIDATKMFTITIRCPHCNSELKAARDRLFMTPVTQAKGPLALVTDITTAPGGKPDKVNEGDARVNIERVADGFRAKATVPPHPRA